MEKEKDFYIDYSGSGVGGLKFLSVFSLIVGILGSLILLIVTTNLNYREVDLILPLLLSSLFLLISGITLSIIFKALKTITINSLYQKCKLVEDLKSNNFRIRTSEDDKN